MDILTRDSYFEYDQIIDMILKYLYLANGRHVHDTFKCDSDKISKIFRDISLRLNITSSYPTGSRAYESMTVYMYTDFNSVKNFNFKYNRLNGTIQFDWIRTVNCEVPYEFSNYQSNNFENVIEHVEKFMKFHIILPILKEMYGNSFNFDEIDDCLNEMICMYKI